VRLHLSSRSVVNDEEMYDSPITESPSYIFIKTDESSKMEVLTKSISTTSFLMSVK
jgi:hypothetical protein